MTDKHLFALSAAVSLCTLISLIWRPENKSLLWRYTMFGSFALYAVTAMLAWLNQYTAPNLYPFYFFGYTTLAMMALIALNYFLALRAPVVVPDEIVDQLSVQSDATTLIERYRLGLENEQKRRLRAGTWVAGSGSALIGLAFIVIHSYGLAENLNGQQESLSKTLFRLIDEVRLMSVKVDTLVAAGNRRERRINKLEVDARRKAHIDSVNTLRVLGNQKDIKSDLTITKARLKPKAVPQTVPPIKPKKKWWEIGYLSDLSDTLVLAKKY